MLHVVRDSALRAMMRLAKPERDELHRTLLEGRQSALPMQAPRCSLARGCSLAIGCSMARGCSLAIGCSLEIGLRQEGAGQGGVRHGKGV